MTASSFPHPVLGHSDDYASGRFGLHEQHLRYEVTGGVIRLSGRFELEQPELQGLIEAGHAQYVIQLDSPKTMFRSVHGQTDETFVIEVPADEVRSELHAGFLLCATSDLPGFQPTGLNEDFGPEAAFEIRMGDLLGLAGTIRLPVDQQYDPLASPLGSIIVVDVDDTVSEVGVDLHRGEGDKIVILLPRTLHTTFLLAKHSPAILACLVLPALSHVLELMRSPERAEEFQDYAWFHNLQGLMTHKGLDQGLDAFQQAQRLLGSASGQTNPIALALAQLATVEVSGE
ncbi:hypothetical protein [Deinococcus hohokamensis]|uniref:Uncharacterized protein n=1 Tax=Deinococcus hohokamensis TaxID=309883 RepID=A0ABV9IEN3_9DEIO